MYGCWIPGQRLAIMPRGVGRTGSGRPVLSEVPQNGEPPKSTLAAQLVNQLADSKRHPKNQDQETFRQLLREILNAENDHDSHASSHDVDSNVDYKLVYVVIKAGLETPTGESPFDKQAEYFRQVHDSLAAVEYTLVRNPKVLYADAPAQVPGPDHQGPLFLWLIPKILAITGESQQESIANSILKLFRTILFSEKNTHSTRVKKYSILKYVKGCFKGSYAINVVLENQ